MNTHLRHNLLDELPEDAADIVRQLLTVQVDHRLGCRKRTDASQGALEEIKAHPFFAGLNWEALLRKQLPPPLSAIISIKETSDSVGPSKHKQNDALKSIERNFIQFLNAPAAELCDAAASGDMLKLNSLLNAGNPVSSRDDQQRTALHYASANGHLNAVEVLIDAGADHSMVDLTGLTATDTAVNAGHTQIAQLLQSLGARRSSLPPLPDNPQGALCDAASKGDVDQLRSLLSRGLDVNVGDYDRRTALHLSASEGLLGAVQFLVTEAHADPSPVDRWGGTPLDDAIRSSDQHVEMGSTGTHHHGTVVFLKAVGAKRGATARILRAAHEAAQDLCAAAHAGDILRLKRLVLEDGVDIDSGDYDARTAIHLAASEGRTDVVSLLLGELKAAPSPRDRWGNTPLDDANRSGHKQVAERLKLAGGCTGAEYVGNSGRAGLNFSVAFDSSSHGGRSFVSEGSIRSDAPPGGSSACEIL